MNYILKMLLTRDNELHLEKLFFASMTCAFQNSIKNWGSEYSKEEN
jgi:hypothetical protein